MTSTIDKWLSKWYIELITVIILFLLICLVYKDQKRIALNSGQGWDGVYYTQMAEQIKSGTRPIAGELPFVKRIGTPFLVASVSSLTRKDVLDSALIVNLSGAFLSVLLLIFWLRRFIQPVWIRIMLIFLYMMAYHVPLRFTFYHPQGTDSWGSVFLLGGLLLLNLVNDSYIRSGKLNIYYVLCFSIVVSLGIFFRETNIVLSILPFFVLQPFNIVKITPQTITGSNLYGNFRNLLKLYWSKQLLIILVPLLFSIASMYSASFLTVDSGQQKWSYFRTVILFFYTRSLPEYLLGLFNAYGPLLLLVTFYFCEYKILLKQRQDLTFLLLATLVLAFIGGPSTERIAFMNGFPVVFILLGAAINRIYLSPQRWWFFLMLILQSIAFRFFWHLPDYPTSVGKPPIPFFTLIGDKFNLLYLLSYHGHGHLIVNTILFLEYLFLFAATYLVITNKLNLPFTKTSQKITIL